MVRRSTFLGLIALALVAFGYLPKAIAQPPLPKLDSVPDELRRELERMLAEAQLQQDPRLGGRLAPVANVRWGGLQVRKVDAELQEKLGLPDNEGMFVAAVDPNSAADRAGLKVNDVIVKINDKAAPNHPLNFANLVKDQKANDGFIIIVVRNGKEETLKGVQMPQSVQSVQSLPGFGGGRAGGLPGFNNQFKRVPLQPRGVMPAFDGNFRDFQMESNIDGVKISRKQTGDDFTGTYEKDGLKVTLTGKFESGRPKVSEITVQEGKETKKYADPRDVPIDHRPILIQLMPSPINLGLRIDRLPNLRDFPGLPVIPGIDNNK